MTPLEIFEGKNSSLRKTFNQAVNTPDTEWEKEFEHLSVSILLREKDPTYGEENRRAKQQLKTFITTLLTSRDTYWKERVRKELEGMKKDGSDETKDRIEKDGYGYLYERLVGYNIALKEVDTLLDNLK